MRHDDDDDDDVTYIGSENQKPQKAYKDNSSYCFDNLNIALQLLF